MARQAGEAVLRHPGGVGDDDFLQVLAEAPGAHRHRHVGRGRQPPVLRRLPRDQPRLRPALPQAGRRATASSAASAPPSRCTCAARTRSRRCMAEVLRRHGLPVLPEEIGFTEDGVRPRRWSSPRRPAPAATRSSSTSTCPPTRSGTHTPTMPKPSVAELRPVVHPAGVKDRRSGEHWAGRLYMREVSLRVDRLPGEHQGHAQPAHVPDDRLRRPRGPGPAGAGDRRARCSAC